MPIRHGTIVRSGDQPRCQFGIWRVFAPWVDPNLLVLQGHDDIPITRPLKIEFHFRYVVRRLLRSLGRLYRDLRKYDRFIEDGALFSQHPYLAIEIPEEAGIAADSIFHYLNLVIDDLARVIPFVFAKEGSIPKEPDGFAGLKKMLAMGNLSVPQTLIQLFSELDHEPSWWYLGFKPGVGMRQRLTHYIDLIIFQFSTKPGDSKMTADVHLSSVGGPIHIKDFEQGLENLFTDLCEWLDRLEHELLDYLSKMLARKGVSWNPFREPCPGFELPELEESIIDLTHYMFLPICDEAEIGDSDGSEAPG
jgi:hypothetical protein